MIFQYLHQILPRVCTLVLFHYIQFVYTAQNRYNNYGAPWWTIFGDELSECRRDVGLSVRCWVVGAMFPPSIFEDRCVDLRRSMCRLSKIDDRCADLRRSMALCRPSKTDDRFEIMLPHLLETLMV